MVIDNVNNWNNNNVGWFINIFILIKRITIYCRVMNNVRWKGERMKFLKVCDQFYSNTFNKLHRVYLSLNFKQSYRMQAF